MTKYGAIRSACAQGHMHASKMEARRCDELTTLEKAGAISILQQQPVFPCLVNGATVCRYVGDFAYFTDKTRVVEDVKGMVTPVFRLKKKLVEACHPGTVITLYPPKPARKRKAKAA